MHITIENNTVVVNLDETEFPLFEAMFANLKLDKTVAVEFRKFPNIGGQMSWKLLPMHLCRTIGEANLSEDPFATVSLYPFWKHGFAFGEKEVMRLSLGIDDPHKKGVAADEFGMGFCAWAMEEIFDCVEWADTSALLKQGAVFPVGTKRPDFVCTFSDSSLGIFEGKGTTGTNINQAISEGKGQTAGITAPVPIKYRVAVGAILGNSTKIILLDPPDPVETGHDPSLQSNLTPDLVAKAAKAMRIPPSVPPLLRGDVREDRGDKTEALFRGPDGEIKLVNEQKPEKRHGWLEIRE